MNKQYENSIFKMVVNVLIVFGYSANWIVSLSTIRLSKGKKIVINKGCV